MVVNEIIKCCICEQSYRLRVGVGFDSYQKHYFDCIDCEQPIVFALKAVAPAAWVEVCENCVISESAQEPKVMNFHPNCAFSINDLHSPFSFASIENMQMIAPHMRLRRGLHQDVSSQFDVPGAPELWQKIKSIISLEQRAGNKKRLEKILQGYTLQRRHFRPGYVASSSNQVLTEFFKDLFYPKINNLVEPVIGLIEQINKDSELSAFYEYYRSVLKNENLDRYLATFSDYFRYRDHFGQLVFHARVSSEDVDELIVSSKNFDHIRLYYGQVYEALTSNFTILACINNLSHGRAYDSFKQMSLAKYTKNVDKSKRHMPFKNEPEFMGFIDGLNSSVRNGSHHASIWRSGEQVMYRSGGSGAQNKISYSRYLHDCNKLTIALAAILLIELYIQKICEQ